jgi:hypothetical protein
MNAKTTSPFEETQENSVTVKLGKTHYEALERWSRERFGIPNCAGMVRLILHERLMQENGQKAEEGNGAQ